jgi:cytochrome b561
MIMRYTPIAITLHWLVAVLMIINVALVLTVDYWPEAWVRPVIDTHKSIGITVLGLALLRLLWRLGHAPPPLPADMPALERRGAHAAHWLLYLVIFALPLSGWLHDSAWKDAASHPMTLFGAIPWPRIGFITGLEAGLKEQLHDIFGEVHEWFGYGLYGLVALHIAGALKHQFIDRHAELQRMWPGRG